MLLKTGFFQQYSTSLLSISSTNTKWNSLVLKSFTLSFFICSDFCRKVDKSKKIKESKTHFQFILIFYSKNMKPNKLPSVVVSPFPTSIIFTKGFPIRIMIEEPSCNGI